MTAWSKVSGLMAEGSGKSQALTRLKGNVVMTRTLNFFSSL